MAAGWSEMLSRTEEQSNKDLLTVLKLYILLRVILKLEYNTYWIRIVLEV